jgi:nitrite reductase/ring-hydroxylating ferredoxin subunit
VSTQSKPIPKWREDFPIESEGDDFITRRDFLRFLTLVSAGLAVGNGALLVKSLAETEGPFPRVELGATGDMEPGTWKVFNYPEENVPAILVRRENGAYLAFHQKCPHLACPVSYHPSEEGEGECFRCHCHNGRFDIATGQGTHGPPRELRPLRQVVLEESDGRLYATGLNELHFT